MLKVANSPSSDIHSSLSIKPFEEHFRTAVIQLWTDCGLVKAWNDPSKDIDRKLVVDPQLFLIATANQQLLATVIGGYEGHRGWINYLAVAPHAQRQHIGSTLMSAIEEKLLQLNCPKINLQIRSSNVDVIEFYRSLGYREDDVVSMGKRLIED